MDDWLLPCRCRLHDRLLWGWQHDWLLWSWDSWENGWPASRLWCWQHDWLLWSWDSWENGWPASRLWCWLHSWSATRLLWSWENHWLLLCWGISVRHEVLWMGRNRGANGAVRDAGAIALLRTVGSWKATISVRRCGGRGGVGRGAVDRGCGGRGGSASSCLSLCEWDEAGWMIRDGSACGPMTHAGAIALLCSIWPSGATIGTIFLGLHECLLAPWRHACLCMGAKVLEDRSAAQRHAHEANDSEDLAVGARLNRIWLTQQSLRLMLHHLRLHCKKNSSAFD